MLPMTDLAIATTCILSVFLAGVLRAWLDKQVWIFILSTGVSLVLTAAVMFNHYGAFTPLVEVLFLAFILLMGAALSAFCSLSEKDYYEKPNY